MRRQSSIIYVILLSLGLHALSWLSVVLLPDYSNPNKPALAPLEWLDLKTSKSDQKNKNQEFIPSIQNLLPKTKPSEEDLEKKARFISKDDQRVKDEMKAQFVPGMTSQNSAMRSSQQQNSETPQQSSEQDQVKNRESKNKQQKSSQTELAQKAENAKTSERKEIAKEQAARVKLFDSSSENDVAVENSDQSRRPIGGSLGGASPLVSFSPPSVLGIDLPDDVKLGPMTILDTDATPYFSFYDRMQRLTYYRWAKMVEEAVQWLTIKNRLPLSPRNFATDLEVVLDEEGNFVRANLLQSSSIDELDEAAAAAFEKARTIPNPPQDLIKGGYVRVRARFTVYYHPNVRAFR